MRIVSFGGFIDYQIQLANALSKKETVMLVIPTNKLPSEHIGSIDKKVDFHSLGRGKPWYHPISFLIFKDFLEMVKKFGPDVIHVQGRSSILYCLFIYPYLKKNYPLVFTLHDVEPHSGVTGIKPKLLWYLAERYFNHVIVHGEKLKEQMIQEYNHPKEKVHVIPIGQHDVVPFKKYERKEFKEVGNLILFLGRIYKYKGLEYLIKAEPMITNEVPNAKIVIAGTGENFKKYEEMMANRDNFIVHNYHIPYKEGAELFQRCSVVVLPYIDASQSAVIPLAYAFKKSVVVTDVGSIPEIVDDGVTGFIVPPRNPEALADAIVKLLKDEKLRKQMGENAYKKLKRDLSWDKIAEKTIEVYKKAIAAKNEK